MGQRHQILWVIPEIYYNQDNPNNRTEQVVGIHHQWLFGKRVVVLLNNFLRFLTNLNKNAVVRINEKTPFDYGHKRDCEQMLSHAYSIDFEAGQYTEVGILKRLNPEHLDNNDGITVIDSRDYNNPKYCFFTPEFFEVAKIHDYTPYTPYNLEEYKRIYGLKEDKECEKYIKERQALTQKELLGIINMAKKQDEENNQQVNKT